MELHRFHRMLLFKLGIGFSISFNKTAGSFRSTTICYRRNFKERIAVFFSLQVKCLSDVSKICNTLFVIEKQHIV